MARDLEKTALSKVLIGRGGGGNAQHTYHLWGVAVRIALGAAEVKDRVSVGIHGDGLGTVFHRKRRATSGVRIKGRPAENKALATCRAQEGGRKIRCSRRTKKRNQGFVVATQPCPRGVSDKERLETKIKKRARPNGRRVVVAISGAAQKTKCCYGKETPKVNRECCVHFQNRRRLETLRRGGPQCLARSDATGICGLRHQGATRGAWQTVAGLTHFSQPQRDSTREGSTTHHWERKREAREQEFGITWKFFGPFVTNKTSDLPRASASHPQPMASLLFRVSVCCVHQALCVRGSGVSIQQLRGTRTQVCAGAMMATIFGGCGRFLFAEPA